MKSRTDTTVSELIRGNRFHVTGQEAAMKFFRGIPRTTVFSMLVVLVAGQVSPLSLEFSTSSSDEAPAQAAAITISFQDGVSPTSFYRGTSDTMISEDDPNRNFGTDDRLGIDGDDPPGTRQDRSVLLSWSLTDIPKFSSITSASITLHFDNRSTDSHSTDRYSLYAMKRDWYEGQATWNRSQISSFWSLPGALSTNDRSYFIGNFVPSQGQEQTIVLNSTGVSIVQTWVNDPARNYGLILASPTNTDGADFLSSETSIKTYRPKLTVRYLPKETISLPPTNRATGSLFQYRGVSSAGVQATISRSNTSFGEVPIYLQLNRTLAQPDWSVANIYSVDLSLFDRNTSIRYSLTNSQGTLLGSWNITSQEIINNPAGFQFIYGMGKLSGTYTVTFNQGNRTAGFRFTIPERNTPDLKAWPECISPGQQFILYIAGLPKGTPLDIYRHYRDSGLNSYYKYVNSLPAPNVNERGEAYYYLQTLTNDPKESYLMIARGQRTEVSFELPCPH